MRGLVLSGLLAAGGVQPSSGSQGYRSSEQWLPREPVITGPTGDELLKNATLPLDFDWRDVGGRSWVTADLNQHIPMYCGSCWIHGVTHAVNDRIKIMRGGRFPDVLVSRQALMNCVPDGSGGPNPGCNGGDAWMIHKYMHEHKVPDDSCMPYVAMNQQCEPENMCRNCFHNITVMPDGHPFFTPGKCFGVKHWTGYGVSEYGNFSGEVAMMKEIYARGPIVCSAATDDTFVYNYSLNEGILRENVYITDMPYTTAQIDHVMEVAGWGETASGTKYWVVRNSWGSYWGDMGWVKIRRGVNQMQIESACDWAVPDVQDVEEQLRGQVLGDYIDGIRVVPRRGAGQPSHAPAEAILGLARAPVPATSSWAAVVAAVVCGALGAVVGAAGARASGKGRVQQRELLG